MRRAGQLIERIATLDNLYDAFRRASRGKHLKREVKVYSERLEDNLAALRRQLLSGEADVGHYSYFTIHEPKERVICAASFAERVLHHALMNVCHRYFDRSLIDSTCATRIGKGVYVALDMAVRALTRYPYSAKLDVRKYFDSIDHAILEDMLARKFKEKTLLRVFHSVIDSYHVAPEKGVPIGNLTSQYFANMYLSSLDHFAKQELGVPIYIRYMDDILIVASTKEEISRDVRAVTDFARSRLSLTMKPPVCQKSSSGQVFLGYRVLPHHYLLAGKSKRRFRSRLLEYGKLLDEGEWSQETYRDHVEPLLAFTRHAASREFRKACLNV